MLFISSLLFMSCTESNEYIVTAGTEIYNAQASGSSTLQSILEDYTRKAEAICEDYNYKTFTSSEKKLEKTFAPYKESFLDEMNALHAEFLAELETEKGVLAEESGYIKLSYGIGVIGFGAPATTTSVVFEATAPPAE